MSHDADHELGWASIDGVVVLDVVAPDRPDHAVVRAANDAACTLLKVAREDLVGKELGAFLVPSFDRLRERPAGTRVDGIARTAHGAELPVHLWLRAGAAASTFAVVLRDASEWEVAKSTLSLVAAGVEHAADAFEITDADGSIEYANAAHGTLTGAPLFDVVGAKITAFLEDNGGVHAEIDRALRAGQPWRGEVECRRADGALRWHDLSITPVFDGRGGVRRFVAVRRDITDRIELERDLEEMRARLSADDRANVIARLAGTVAHEVNNPATSILANLEIAGDEIDQLAREVELARVTQPPAQLVALEAWWRRIRIDERLGAVRESLSDSWEGMERVVRLVRDLRGLVQVHEVHVGAVSLNDVVRSILRVTRSHLFGRARLVVEHGAVARVLADERRLGYVIMSLLTAAAQAITPGHETEHEVRVRTSAGGDGRVLLTIENTGVTVAAEDLPRVFDPFFTSTSLGDGAGVGLGLAVARDIVESFDGEIRLERAERGSRVLLLLRAATDDHVVG